MDLAMRQGLAPKIKTRMMKTAGTMSQVPWLGHQMLIPLFLTAASLPAAKDNKRPPVITEDRTSSDNHDGMERNPDVSRVFEAG